MIEKIVSAFINNDFKFGFLLIAGLIVYTISKTLLSLIPYFLNKNNEEIKTLNSIVKDGSLNKKQHYLIKSEINSITNKRITKIRNSKIANELVNILYSNRLNISKDFFNPYNHLMNIKNKKITLTRNFIYFIETLSILIFSILTFIYSLLFIALSYINRPTVESINAIGELKVVGKFYLLIFIVIILLLFSFKFLADFIRLLKIGRAIKIIDKHYNRN
ncbi:hypothetical protein QQ39_05255 [Pragia fontium]|nr:hypothetical protein QQ39_05255 [Pragia fontium]